MTDQAKIRRKLLAWYQRAKRDLPWRRTRDPYRIWLSEIMLQQTRVAAVIPYYQRFLERFPTVRTLAEAPEQEVLTYWSGLGYYSRARHFHQAAREIAHRTQFPRTHEEILALPGIGAYTAAAIASIAYGLPHAAVDGNVRRVLSRLLCEPGDIRGQAQALLDARHPGECNQALMELGATVCLPKRPQCQDCPLAAHCQARLQSRQQEFPVRLKKQIPVVIEETILLIRNGEEILFRQRPPEDKRMPGFWELPLQNQIPGARLGRELGSFRHSITFHNYIFQVREAKIEEVPEGFQWMRQARLGRIPLSTITRKSLNLTPETRFLE